MALMKSFLSNVKNVWQSPEQAVIEEENIGADAFVTSDTVSRVPSTDTVSADNITNTYIAPKAEARKPQADSIYANPNNYSGDGYEDLTDVNFTVAKSARFEEEPKQVQAVVSRKEVVASAADSAPVNGSAFSKIETSDMFKGFVDTGYLFSGTGNATASAAVKTEPRREVNFTPVVPLDEIFAPRTQEIKTEVRPAEAPRAEIREERKAEINAAPAKQESAPAKNDNVVKASVGFNTATATVSTSSFTSSKLTTGGRTMAADKISVQILKPTKVEDVSEACAILKEGNIVMAVLSGIGDKNARLRYLDYLSGCCKGCDADFKEIVKVDSIDCVLVAAPRGVGLKFPVLQAYVQQEAAPAEETAQPEYQARPQVERQSAFASVFGNVDLGGGKGASTNWYTDRF